MRCVELANGSHVFRTEWFALRRQAFWSIRRILIRMCFYFLSVCSCTQNTTTPGVFYESCFLEALRCPSCIREVWQCFLTQFRCTFADSKQKLWPLLSLLWKGIFALDTGSSRTVGRYRSALIVWNVKETQNICWERLAVMEFAPRDWRCPRHTHTLLHSFWLVMLGIIHPPSGRHLRARELFAIVQSP